MLLGSIFSFAAINSRPRTPNRIAWIAALLLLIFFVGLRHHVGMDWNNYIRMINKVAYIHDWRQYSELAEPGYTLLLIIGEQSGGGIYVTNFIGAVIFCTGLFVFAHRSPEPWLALMVALPFFVIAFSMSANRQAVACGLLMIAIGYWDKWGVSRKIAMILLATLFHFSALIMLAFIGTSLHVRFRVKVILVVLVALVVLYLLQSSGQGEYYNSVYGQGQTSYTRSSGALIHVALTSVPASLCVLWPRVRNVLFPNKLMRHMAIAAMMTLPLALIASAAAGRLSLYWYPMAMMALAALPRAIAPSLRIPMRALITFLMMLEMAVWLLFANSSFAHLPYQNALFTPGHKLHIRVIR